MGIVASVAKATEAREVRNTGWMTFHGISYVGGAEFAVE